MLRRYKMIKVDVITGSVMMYIHTMDYDLTANIRLLYICL